MRRYKVMNSVGKSLILIYTVELPMLWHWHSSYYLYTLFWNQKSGPKIISFLGQNSKRSESKVFVKIEFLDPKKTFRIVLAAILLFSWIYRKSKVGDKQKNRLKSFHKTRDQEVPRCWVCRCQCKKRSNAEKGTWQFHRKMIHGNPYVILKYYYRVHIH